MRFAAHCPLSVHFLLLPLFLTAACDSGHAPGPQVQRSDSAGIEIVRSDGTVDTPAEAGGGWGVHPEPLLTIGSLAGDSVYQLFQVQGALRMMDGRIVVANAGSGELRIFDSLGRFLLSHGRKGEGPGEFQSPALAGLLSPDTLVVVDSRLRRISMVHADHGFLESAPISEETAGGAYARGLLQNRTVLLGGGFSWNSASGDALEGGYQRPETTYQTVGLDGSVVRDLGGFPGSEFHMRVSRGSGGISMMASLIPFGKHAMTAVGGGRVFFGSGDQWEVRAYGEDGTLARILRTDRSPTPVTPAMVDAYIEREVAASDGSEEDAEIRRRIQDLPLPEFLPAYASLFAGRDGTLLVERYRLPGDDVPVLDVFDPDGGWVGEITLPSGSQVLDMGQDFLLTRQLDELEVEHIQMLRLDRS